MLFVCDNYLCLVASSTTIGADSICLFVLALHHDTDALSSLLCDVFPHPHWRASAGHKEPHASGSQVKPVKWWYSGVCWSEYIIGCWLVDAEWLR